MRASILFGLLILTEPISAMQFTEVMYDPPGSDNNKEFIEIHGESNLSGWIIGDLASNDTLVPLFINASSNYSIIVEEGFEYENLSCNVYSAGATIGNNLNNAGDAIRLYAPNGSLALEFWFDDSLAKNNGMALALLNGTWQEALPTPCVLNIYYMENNSNITDSSAYDLSLTPALPTTIYAGVSYDSLFRIRNELYETGVSGYVNASAVYNLSQNGSVLVNGSFSVVLKSYKTAGTGRLQINATGNYTLCARIAWTNVTDENPENDAICQEITVLDPFAQPCNVSLELQIKEPQLYYESGNKIKFWNKLLRHDNNTELPPYIIRYEIQDLQGKTVRVTTTENQNLKTWTPKLKDALGVFILTNQFDMLACNNSNNDTQNKQLIVVQGEKVIPENESSIEITNLHIPKKGYRFGDIVKVSMHAYKGNTSKYSIKLYVEDVKGRKVSSTTSFHAKQKFQDYQVTMPIVLKDSTKSGQHKVVIEGLGKQRSKNLWIKTKEIKIVQNVTAHKPKKQFSIASFYTRSKKANKKINVYARIKGKGNATLELVGLEDHDSVPISINKSFSYKKEVAMQNGPNVFLLKILEKEKILDQRTLLLEMDTEIQEVQFFSGKRKTLTRPNSPSQATNSTPNKTSLLTGAATYTTKSTTRTVPILLGIIGTLLLGIILQHKR